MKAETTLAAGERALAEGRWEQARDLFDAAVRDSGGAAAWSGLADARWWTGDAAGCVGAMERAHVLHRRGGEVEQAVMTAVWLSLIYRKSLGNRSACRGWVARAARLVDGASGEGGAGALAGWVSLARAHETTEAAKAVAHARHALAAARAAADTDLELCALAELGRALVAAGSVEDGLACVDEAMAGAYAGEYHRPDTVAAASCSMLDACELAADRERVSEWFQVASRFMRSYGSPFLYADCRLHYGGVLLDTGRWQEAEQELRAALQAAPAPNGYRLRALCKLATLRVWQGRLAEAAGLLQEVGEHPLAWPVRARLQCAQGEYEAAVATLARGPDGALDLTVEAAELRGLRVWAQLAGGDLKSARAALRGFDAGRSRRETPREAGHAALARGRVALAAEQHTEAVTLLGQAVGQFQAADLPHDAARARLALAGALAARRADAAVAEAREALAMLEQLGARPEADAAAGLLRALGAPARTGPKGLGPLTQREQDVLRLLGEGLSNPEIAARLVISRKTAAHHVSNVLSKLGLRNRAEAAAYATRRG